jgi:hypothetical protein
MKLTTLVMAVVTTMACGHAAEARTHHHVHAYRHIYRHIARRHAIAHHRWARRDRRRWFAETRYAFGGGQWGGGYGPRPAAWCGWEMRHLVSSDPGPAYNLARNWAHWGHAGAPGVGAVVVWPHHVGKIVGREDGMWVIESGNDGHRLRTRPRSLAGAIAFRWS